MEFTIMNHKSHNLTAPLVKERWWQLPEDWIPSKYQQFYLRIALYSLKTTFALTVFRKVNQTCFEEYIDKSEHHYVFR